MPSTEARFDKARHRRRIALLAQAMLGARFRHQGRSARHGVDCVGLAAVICDRLAIAYPDRRDYPRRPAEDYLLAQLLAAGFVMSPGRSLQAGQLALLAIDGRTQHCAVIIEGGLVHACARSRRVVQQTLSPLWRGATTAILDFP